MDVLGSDLRTAVRGLERSPGFSLIAVLTLALGVGLATALFSVVDGILLKPLPYRDPGRLVIVQETTPALSRAPLSSSVYARFRDRNQVFTGMAAYFDGGVHLTGEGEPERLQARFASHELLGLLGVEARYGRGFAAADDVPDAPPAAILTDPLFQRRFGGDPSVIGRKVLLDGDPTVILGVLPPSYSTGSHEVLIPLRLDLQKSDFGLRWLNVLARLAPGAGVESARSELSALAAELAVEQPETEQATVVVDPLHARIVEPVRAALLVLLAAVGVVLAIACANVANLLLSRLVARERDVAVRVAFGARRRRIVRYLLTECAVLCATGCGLGVALAVGLLRLLVGQAAGLPRVGGVALDHRALAFAVTSAVATGVCFSLLPSWQASRIDLASTLKAGGRNEASHRRASRMRRGLVVGEVALATLLLVGAGVLLRTLHCLLAIDPGFRAEGVMTARVELPKRTYPDEEARGAFYQSLFARLEALPGVESAGAIFPLPLSGTFARVFEIEGRSPRPAGQELVSRTRVASPGYFATMSIPLLRGRAFDAGDDSSADSVAVINQEAVARFFPGEDPLGQRIVLFDSDDLEPRRFTVIGIVGDVRESGLADEPVPEIYWPYAQDPFERAAIVLRTDGSDPTLLAEPLRFALNELDPRLPLSRVMTLQQIVEGSLAKSRFSGLWLSIFAALALALAAVGLYGVITLAVGQRQREIAIRRALGAPTGQVIALVFGEARNLVGAGLAIGLAAAYFATRLLAGLVYGVRAFDPLTVAVVPVVVATVAFLACAAPALRAARVPPALLLRES